MKHVFENRSYGPSYRGPFVRETSQTIFYGNTFVRQGRSIFVVETDEPLAVLERAKSVYDSMREAVEAARTALMDLERDRLEATAAALTGEQP